MEAVADILSSIASGISTALEFLISFFEDIFYVIKLTGEFVLEIPNYFSWLPAEVVASLVSIFAIVVIYKVLGREG